MIGYVGPYRLLGELGQGASGVVYLAKRRRLSKDVAIKLVRSGKTIDAQGLMRELRALSQLDHPRVVKLLDSGMTDGHPPMPYMVTEYVPGGSLRRLLRSGESLSPGQALCAIVQVAEALEHAHGRGLVHRDIKPENIYTDGRGGVKLGDFGLAKLAAGGETLTLYGTLVGSPPYMSPEQFSDSRNLTKASDVYQLGVLAYELLTGARPFEGRTVGEVYHKVLHLEAPDPRQAAPSLPAEAARLMLSALQKDPRNRPASAAAFAVGLRQALGVSAEPLPLLPPGEEAEVASVSHVPPGVRPPFPKMINVVTVVLASLAMALFVCAGLAYLRRPPTLTTHVPPPPQWGGDERPSS